MRNVAIVGIDMTRFGKFIDRSMKSLAHEAIEGALKNAGVDKKAIQVATVGNAAAGLMSGQEMVRAQVILREMGFEEIPMMMTENACATASTALHLAWLYVASGMYDIALAAGVEKLYHADKTLSFKALGSAVDLELVAETLANASKIGGGAAAEGAGEKRSMFMDFYGAMARNHMEKYGTKPEHFGKIAVKSHYNASLNPKAQYRERYTLEEVMASPPVVFPLTRLMCAPIGDGAAAAVLMSEEMARKFTTKPIWIRASVLGSGKDHLPGEEGIEERVARKAYEVSGIGPKDVNVVELHDAAAPAELIVYEALGLCAKGDGGKLVDEGATEITGRIPVNTSGGLMSKGHPVGATGIAMVYELCTQLRGEAGDRQIGGNPKVGLSENGGGMIRGESAANVVHIVSL